MKICQLWQYLQSTSESRQEHLDKFSPLALGKRRRRQNLQEVSNDHYKSENNPNFVSTINVMPTWNLLDRLTRNGLEKFIYKLIKTVRQTDRKADRQTAPRQRAPRKSRHATTQMTQV